MTINITAYLMALLSTSAYCLAQTDADAKRRSLENTIQALSEKYGITGVTKPYQNTGQRVISGIQPILKWLDDEYAGRDWSVSSSETATQFYKSFRVTTSVSTRDESLQIRLQVANKFENAEKLAALSMSYVLLPDPGKNAFSGPPLGDWSYHEYYRDVSATLTFVRKNVVVWIGYGSAAEALPDRKIRSIPDPSIGAKCEAIAREIDGRIILLPVE